MLSTTIAALCLSLGCSVDERKLAGDPAAETVGSSGSAGVDDALGGQGGDGASGRGTWSDCGEGGAAGASNRAHCWSFDDGTEGFVAEAGVEQMFTPDEDASGDPNSGSLTVANVDVGSDDATAAAGTTQCLAVPYADTFSLEVSAFIPSQQAIGGASVDLQFINVSGCQGLELGDHQYADATPLKWQRIQASGMVPRGTHAALLRLLVSKLHSEPSFSARFDQVRLTFE